MISATLNGLWQIMTGAASGINIVPSASHRLTAWDDHGLAMRSCKTNAPPYPIFGERNCNFLFVLDKKLDNPGLRREETLCRSGAEWLHRTFEPIMKEPSRPAGVKVVASV